MKFHEFMKTKKNHSKILSNFQVVARLYLCHVSESKGTCCLPNDSFLGGRWRRLTTAAEQLSAGSRRPSHRTQGSNILFGDLPSLRCFSRVKTGSLGPAWARDRAGPRPTDGGAARLSIIKYPVRPSLRLYYGAGSVGRVLF